MSILIHLNERSKFTESQTFLRQLKKQTFQNFTLSLPQSWKAEHLNSYLESKLIPSDTTKLHYYASVYEKWEENYLQNCADMELSRTQIYIPKTKYFDQGNNLIVEANQKEQLKKIQKHGIELAKFSDSELLEKSKESHDFNVTTFSSSICLKPIIPTNKIGSQMSAEDHKDISYYHYEVGKLFYFINFDRGMAIYHFAQSVRFKEGPKRAWAFYIFSMFAPRFIISASRGIFPK